jgi:hypothetical protein
MIEALWALYILVALLTAQVGSKGGANGFIACCVLGAAWPFTWLVAIVVFLSLPPD